MSPDVRRLLVAAVAMITGLALFRRRPTTHPPKPSGRWEPVDES